MKLFSGSEWGGIVLLSVGVIAAIVLFGSLVFDAIHTRRRQRRYERFKKSGAIR